MPSRRDFLTLMTTLWLARAIESADAAPAPLRDSLQARLRRLADLSRALAQARLRPLEWQREVEALALGIDLRELCHAADFDRVAAHLEPAKRGVNVESVRLAGLADQPFAAKIFVMGRGRAIIPHGHKNMVSHLLVLKGELRGRHFERVRDEPGHLVLRPTIDRIFRAGDGSSISEERDNVHWFVAKSERAYTLDAIVDNLHPQMGYRFHIDNVDPAHAEPGEGGTLRARILELDEALRLYG